MEFFGRIWNWGTKCKQAYETNPRFFCQNCVPGMSIIKAILVSNLKQSGFLILRLSQQRLIFSLDPNPRCNRPLCTCEMDTFWIPLLRAKSSLCWTYYDSHTYLYSPAFYKDLRRFFFAPIATIFNLCLAIRISKDTSSVGVLAFRSLFSEPCLSPQKNR